MEKMISGKDIEDSSALLNSQLIEHIRNYPSLWYKQISKYTENDETVWNAISDDMGVQKSFLKQKWQKIRDDYCKSDSSSRRNTLVKSLSFLNVPKDAIRRNSADEEAEFEFVITVEQLETEDEITLNEKLTLSNIQSQIDQPKDVNPITDEIEKREKYDSNGTKRKQTERNGYETEKSTRSRIKESTFAENVDNRTEDLIFGDFVAATLAKMQPDDKKKAKKEIMNILL